jgi:hypothetical protein
MAVSKGTMIAVALYVLTAVVTGLHVFYLMMWAIWGAPTSPLQYVSLIGSVVLLLSAVAAFFNRRLAAAIAIVGSVMVWSFYAPALVFDFTRLLGLLLHAPKEVLSTMIPILLLAVCTFYGVRHVRKRPATA